MSNTVVIIAAFVFLGVIAWLLVVIMNLLSSILHNRIITYQVFEVMSRKLDFLKEQTDLMKNIDGHLYVMAQEPRRKEATQREYENNLDWGGDRTISREPDPRDAMVDARIENIQQWAKQGIKPTEIAKRLNLEKVTGIYLNGRYKGCSWWPV